MDYLEALTMWVGPPEEFCENSGQDVPPPGGCGPAWAPGGPPLTMWAANLQCQPYYTDWGVADAIHAYHEIIVPGGTYTIEAVDEACDEAVQEHYSDPLAVNTSPWGNICGTYDVGNERWTEPDTSVDVVFDVTACIDKFRNVLGAPIKARADIDSATPEQKINITSDVTRIIDAFGGDPYPFTPDPNPCPGQSVRIGEYSDSGCLAGSENPTIRGYYP
jgi:hypothetical protein